MTSSSARSSSPPSPTRVFWHNKSLQNPSPALNFKSGISLKRLRYLPATFHFRPEIGRLRTPKKNCEPGQGFVKFCCVKKHVWEIWPHVPPPSSTVLYIILCDMICSRLYARHALHTHFQVFQLIQLGTDPQLALGLFRQIGYNQDKYLIDKVIRNNRETKIIFTFTLLFYI